MTRLSRSFYTRDARAVARDLLGRILVTKIGFAEHFVVGGCRTSGRIIETEAYLDIDDLASHSHRGPTKRNEAMFMEGGYAYVYFIYGMYYCFNVVTGSKGAGEAVLIRGLEPIEGIETMRERRGKHLRRDSELTNGPGKLAIALGIGPELNGADLINDNRIWIEEGEALTDEQVIATPRIGITKSAELMWRWVQRKE